MKFENLPRIGLDVVADPVGSYGIGEIIPIVIGVALLVAVAVVGIVLSAAKQKSKFSRKNKTKRK